MRKSSIIRLALLFLMLIIFAIWVGVILSNSNPEEIAKKAQLLEAIYKKGNYIEAGIWGVFAIGFIQVAFKNTGKIRMQRIMAALTFLLFGLSDIVEVKTGAWWHPWWLFLWKSLCVISMVGLLILHWRETHST